MNETSPALSTVTMDAPSLSNTREDTISAAAGRSASEASSAPIHSFPVREVTTPFSPQSGTRLIQTEAAEPAKSLRSFGEVRPNPEEAIVPITRRDCRSNLVKLVTGALLGAFGLGWICGFNWHRLFDINAQFSAARAAISAVLERIIRAESTGDPNARNKHSTATGAGQFVSATWLKMIRAHRPDLALGRNEKEILELRRDEQLTREITTRFAEQNAATLSRRGLPVTPGTLYLAHFAGAAGALAILGVPESADAATIMAAADATVDSEAKRNGFKRSGFALLCQAL